MTCGFVIGMGGIGFPPDDDDDHRRRPPRPDPPPKPKPPGADIVNDLLRDKPENDEPIPDTEESMQP